MTRSSFGNLTQTEAKNRKVNNANQILAPEQLSSSSSKKTFLFDNFLSPNIVLRTFLDDEFCVKFLVNTLDRNFAHAQIAKKWGRRKQLSKNTIVSENKIENMEYCVGGWCSCMLHGKISDNHVCTYL